MVRGVCYRLATLIGRCPHAGTGKTVYIKSQLEQMDKAAYSNIQTAFSAQTTANQVQPQASMRFGHAVGMDELRLHDEEPVLTEGNTAL
jgi:hypothetical protein